MTVATRYYALYGIGAVILLNLLLRGLTRLGGVLATLVVASLVAAGLTLYFRWRQGRMPGTAERWRLTLLYGGGLGLLYLGLLLMMSLQDNPSPMGMLLFALHYLAYPTSLWLALRWPVRSAPV